MSCLRWCLLLLLGSCLAAPPAWCGADPETALIPAGAFIRGSDQGDRDEAPTRKIWLDAYRLDRHEVTNAEYARFLRASDYHFEPHRLIHPELGIRLEKGQYQPEPGMEDLPVVLIDWQEGRNYCLWRGCDLPTEAQWEKACKGGEKNLEYPWEGQGPERPPALNRWWHYRPDPVGGFRPNSYGIYDLGGNVAEMTRDFYDPDYYRNSPDHNPYNENPDHYGLVVIRGGSISSPAHLARCARRSYVSMRHRDMNNFTGLRCACPAAKDQ